MGQTLTHGIYLPDEGERNCYNGLAGNWQLLDNSVGTVAEHTSALSGKAPLVHTHTKADITDFPAYGTTAGTICEGNDSRLSDARTPVAHTHGKADITNLFNSANTWSGNNTYSKPVVIERSTDTGFFLALKNSVAELGSTPASATPATIGYSDKNNDNLGYMGMFYDTDGSNHFRLYVRNKYTSGAPSTSGTTDYAAFHLRLNADQSKEGILRASFRPYDNNSYDLGSFSYQWNNLYAKNYFYNGTAWGLDKDNVWTGNNTFSDATNCVLSFKFGSSGSYSDIRYYDGNDSNYACIRGKVNELALGLKYSSASAWYNGASVVIRNDGNVQIKSYDGTENWTINFTPVGVYPTSDKALELGTSTNKWKSLNGINPGALSLPKTERGVYSLTELSSISGIGVDNWVLNGGKIVIAAEYVITGWLYVCIACDTDGYVILQTGGYSYPNCFYKVTGTPIAGYASATIPIVEGIALTLYLKGTSLIHARYYPAAGNV